MKRLTIACATLFGASGLLISEASAKPYKVTGQCKGDGCEVSAIDGIRALKKGQYGELKAYFEVQGFEKTGSSTEWSDETSVGYALCSESTPLIMGFFQVSSGKSEFSALRPNFNDNVIMAGVSRSNIYEYVCKLDLGRMNRVDERVLKRLENTVKSPYVNRPGIAGGLLG